MRGSTGIDKRGGTVIPLAAADCSNGRPSRKRRGAVKEQDRFRRATRTTALPEPVEDRSIDYAACRPELAGMEPGDIVLSVERLEGFLQVVAPALAAVDRDRRAPRPGETKRRGRPPSFHALDYWRLELLRRVLGKRSTQDTRDWLTTDKARPTRDLLAFNEERPHFGGKPRKYEAGIPSDGWMSDMRAKWLPEPELARLFEATQRWGLAEKVMTIPGMARELELLYADGSMVETHATPPKYREKRDEQGKVVRDADNKPVMELANEDRITAPEAGFIGKAGPDGHKGSGWNVMFITSSKGTVLGSKVVPLHESEPLTLAGMMDELKETLDWTDTPGLRVLTADAAFHNNTLRKALRGVGVVENISLSSHARKVASQTLAERRNGVRLPFNGYNWATNGHREVVCGCGKGKTAREFTLDGKGRAVTRVKGECKTCGSITVTSGAWRSNGNSDGWVKVGHNDKHRGALEVGNALTFNDTQASQFGSPRMNSQEGLFGSQFAQRFNLLRGKRWFYRQTQAQLDVAAVVTITHALSLERHRRQLQAEQSTLPPSQAEPAGLALAA